MIGALSFLAGLCGSRAGLAVPNIYTESMLYNCRYTVSVFDMSFAWTAKRLAFLAVHIPPSYRVIASLAFILTTGFN